MSHREHRDRGDIPQSLFLCSVISAFSVAILIFPTLSFAEDWPQWGGKNRNGDWTETGILEKFPSDGLKIEWRAPIGGGYSGPVVSDEKIVVTDWKLSPETKRLEGTERAVCLDEKTGKVLWTREWPADYSALMQSYASGPRATPTIDADRVYLIGAVGNIFCLSMKTGDVIWQKDCVKEYKAAIPTWGASSAPLVDGDRVIFLAGADPDGKVMAFDKITGQERWRALSSRWEMGYSQPVIYEAGGKRQLIVWHPRAVSSLDPETGKVYWEQLDRTPSDMCIATPVKSGSYLFVASFYGGSMMMELDNAQPASKLLWRIKGKSEMPGKTEALHAVITTPIIIGDYIYGTCSYGELRCLNAKTGERIWSSDKLGRQGRWGSAFWVRNGDRYFVNNDVGDLIIAQFTPEKYAELDRTKLIKPTTNAGFGPRRLFETTVNWVQPAYANRHIVTRNDEEIIRASLEK